MTNWIRAGFTKPKRKITVRLHGHDWRCLCGFTDAKINRIIRHINSGECLMNEIKERG